VGRGEVCIGFWCGSLRETDYLENPGVDGRIILRWIFRYWDVGSWTGSSWRAVVNAVMNLLSSIKCGEFLD
jgi:hypothetical protein